MVLFVLQPTHLKSLVDFLLVSRGCESHLNLYTEVLPGGTIRTTNKLLLSELPVIGGGWLGDSLCCVQLFLQLLVLLQGSVESVWRASALAVSVKAVFTYR
jgi:hypothetical protein